MLATGDKGFDWDIDNGNRTVLWAWGTSQVFDASGFHDVNAGAIDLNLFKSSDDTRIGN